MTETTERAAIRTAVADYMASEGCSCCRDDEAHDNAKHILAKLLKVKKYSDGSGYDFSKYRSKKREGKIPKYALWSGQSS